MVWLSNLRRCLCVVCCRAVCLISASLSAHSNIIRESWSNSLITKLLILICQRYHLLRNSCWTCYMHATSLLTASFPTCRPLSPAPFRAYLMRSTSLSKMAGNLAVEYFITGQSGMCESSYHHLRVYLKPGNTCKRPVFVETVTDIDTELSISISSCMIGHWHWNMATQNMAKTLANINSGKDNLLTHPCKTALTTALLWIRL